MEWLEIAMEKAEILVKDLGEFASLNSIETIKKLLKFCLIT